MARHADQNKLSEAAGAALREMRDLGLLTDTNVAAADTVAGLKTALSNAIAGNTVHGELAPMEHGFLAAIDTLAAIGDISDALIAPLTTVNDLIALTASTNTAQYSNFLP